MPGKNLKPPMAARMILKILSADYNYFPALGDLEEEFYIISGESGAPAAKRWFTRQVLKSIPSLINHIVFWSLTMLNNYLKIAFRNIKKYKAFSFINIFGLAVGITSCFLILLYVQDELSYDRYHEKADQIYRIRTEARINDNDSNLAMANANMAHNVLADYPEVLQSARLKMIGSEVLMGWGDRQFSEKRFLFADSTIFKVFTWPLVEGDPNTALVMPNTIVITETTAKKYFGSENPIGKTLTFEKTTDYTVTGIARDVPVNSHVKFDFLASMATYPQSRTPSTVGNNFHTYLVLQKGFDPKELEAKFPGYVRKYVGPQIESMFGASFDQLLQSGAKLEYYLQPLTDIHLRSSLDYELEPNGNIAYVYTFSIVAFFLLIIACINFMNLATARSANRAKEVGIRKVMGSNKKQLIRQFMAESIFMSSISIIIALILVELLLPFFNNLSGKLLVTNYFASWYIIPGIVGVVVLVGLFAGSYPAFFLASFQPVSVLKGKVRKGLSNSRLRGGLVVFQFTITIFLFIGTSVVYNQLKYVSNKKLGYDKEHVIVLKRARALGEQCEAFKKELLRNSNIVSTAVSNTTPGMMLSDNIFIPEGSTSQDPFLLWYLYTDSDYAETMKIEIAEGRYFSKDIASDSAAVVLNETAVRALGWTENPIGKRLTPMGFRGRNSDVRVIGVVKDFHFESFHKEIRPMLMVNSSYNLSFLNIRVRPENITDTVSIIKREWEKFVPGQPFEFFFLDERYDSLYRSEQLTGEIFRIFSILTIIIASLGLFGLASFTAEQNIKEIGIRKVLGASHSSIILKYSKEFVKWVVAANVLAWPAAWYIMNIWLQDFQYRIDVGFSSFIISGFLALSIAVVTVSYQVIKASLANPVDSLRYE